MSYWHAITNTMHFITVAVGIYNNQRLSKYTIYYRYDDLPNAVIIYITGHLNSVNVVRKYVSNNNKLGWNGH